MTRTSDIHCPTDDKAFERRASKPNDLMMLGP